MNRHEQINIKQLKAPLKTRHILMMALGSAIGTGFFFGAGESISLAGPAIILSYLIGGIIMYIIVSALGEMAVNEPSSGSFSYYAYKYIGDYAGFISGWNYWFNYIIVSMLELTATGMFLNYWFPNSEHWIIIAGIFVFFTGLNLINIKAFGEFEFWFAAIKVITIICLIAFGLYMIIFDQSLGNHQPNINNLWVNGGFFAGGASGFLFSFVVVVFSFGGTELVGITAAEAKDPQKTIPMAIKGIIFRIILFYILTLAIIMCLYPWNKINAHISPFVDVFAQIGIAKAASIINLVAISAALSSFNTGIYSTARMLFNLSAQGNAPKQLNKISSNNIPINAVFVSCACIALTILLNYLFPQQIFNVLLALATIAAIINWMTILFTHYVFKKKTVSKSTFKVIFYPISSIIAFVFLISVSIIMCFMTNMRMAILIAPLWLGGLSIAYLIKKNLQKV